MRKKSSMQNNNYGRKPRFQQQGGGGGHHGHGHGHNRPRKNYGAAREKYLAQARDALAAGDRVLAENYYQHADHCYRMMVEDGSFRQQRPQNPAAPAAEGEVAQAPEEVIPAAAASALPAFITAGYEPPSADAAQAPAVVQDWEE